MNIRTRSLVVYLATIINILPTSGHFQEWTASIPGGYDDAVDVADRHGMLILRGYVNMGKTRAPVFRLLARTADDVTVEDISARLQLDPKIKWASLQPELSRERRYVLPGFSSETEAEDNSHSEGYFRQTQRRTEFACTCKNVSRYPEESFGDHAYEVMDRQSDPSLAHMFNDPKWPCQWELYNCGQTTGPHRVDLNVVPCWEKGFTGKGIVVSVVDDGLDYSNKDLESSYDERASADLNDNYDSDGPLPDKLSIGNDHGTKCGGEIAMKPDNNYCGVGVAFDSSLGGIRFLDGVVTDTSEAAALVFNADYIDIYSCSWGPQDSGKSWEGPGRLASAALEVGSTEGRDGLGSIYVWAAGNGGASGDHCGADGYTCSIYTVAIASVSDQGLSTFYTEPCSCIMAVTLNGGPHRIEGPISQYRPQHYLVTTDPYQGCVNTFSGTSSAAPLASGVIALMLQANPNLTWRDVQHLIVENSKIPNPTEEGWGINGAGFHVHHRYGFGLLDAAKLVMGAQSWNNVDKQHRCEVRFSKAIREIQSGSSQIFKGHSSACADSTNQVQKLEHVQVVMTYHAQCRGEVTIDLISPCGTKSTLISVRPNDDSDKTVKAWPFMTVHSWGEDPRGIWRIKVKHSPGAVKTCKGKTAPGTVAISIKEIHIVFWGTADRKQGDIGCQDKEKMAEEIIEENIQQEPLKVDPKEPVNMDDFVDKEIINAEFVGEHIDDITEDNLKGSKETQRNGPVKEESAQNMDGLREKLVRFLRGKHGALDEEFLRDEIPLMRDAKRNH